MGQMVTSGEHITKGMTIETIIRQYPASRAIFQHFGVPCGECSLAPVDDLATGARIHGIDLAALLAALNTATAGPTQQLPAS